MFKKLLLFLFFVVIIFNLLINNNTATVFNENSILVNTEEYTFYNISLEKVNITTKNIGSYFETIKIIGLYPYFDKSYTSKLESKLDYYSFKFSDLNKNINEFIFYYEQVLKSNGIVDSNIMVNGIKLKKIRIYASYLELNNLLKQNSKIYID